MIVDMHKFLFTIHIFTLVEIKVTLEELNLRRVTVCTIMFTIIPSAMGICWRRDQTFLDLKEQIRQIYHKEFSANQVATGTHGVIIDNHIEYMILA